MWVTKIGCSHHGTRVKWNQGLTSAVLLRMDRILHYFEIMVDPIVCCIYRGIKSSFQGFLGRTSAKKDFATIHSMCDHPAMSTVWPQVLTQAQRALECLGSMHSARLSPDLVAQNAVISAYCQDGRAREARLHLHQVMESNLQVGGKTDRARVWCNFFH